jgi:hypothetical protein
MTSLSVQITAEVRQVDLYDADDEELIVNKLPQRMDQETRQMADFDY